jgi:hypothetical protein
VLSAAMPVVNPLYLFDSPGERPMFEFRDLFQWDRFITPSSTATGKRPDFVGPLEECGLMQVGGH